MDNRIGKKVRNQGVYKFLVGNGADYDTKVRVLRKVFLAPGGEVIDDKDFVTPCEEHLGDMRTYLTATTRNDYFHANHLRLIV